MKRFKEIARNPESRATSLSGRAVTIWPPIARKIREMTNDGMGLGAGERAAACDEIVIELGYETFH
ncbi:hypothetical protein [Caulobacter sp.]|uniref:hypothetical protein n=1 Tax=Caulobacter sp. TaxID=78 RepID=UPI003BB188B8